MEKVLKQDTSDIAQAQNLLMTQLVFLNKPKMCDLDAWTHKLSQRLGEVRVISDDHFYMLSVENYKSRFANEDGGEHMVPAIYNMLEPTAFSVEGIDEIKQSQFWDVQNAWDILQECSYQVMLFDMMALSLEYQKRMELAVYGVEAALELYEDCVGVYAQATGKFMTREQLLAHRDQDIVFRFLSMYVNVRFFHIQNSTDHIIDSLGLFALGLPDVQMHFHGMEPNAVVNHVYNIASYQLANDLPIKNGETIDGLDEQGKIDIHLQWPCRYETSLIQPIRDVLDICPGEYAAGNRESSCT